jgi:MraZ protein
MRPFTGHRDHRIDGKDRVVVPATYAEVIAKHSEGLLYLVPAEDRLCVEAYPARVYDEMAQAVSPSRFQPADLDRQRRFFERAEEARLKGPGRITLPKRFLARYFPKGVVRIAGNNTYLELWDPERWEQHVGDGDPVEEPVAPEPGGD